MAAVGQGLHPTDLLAFGSQDGRILGNLKACLVGDELGRLPGHHGIQLGGGGILAGIGSDTEHVLLQLGLLLPVDEVGTAALHLVDHPVVDVLMGDDGLLGGADHAVIKVLGEDQIIDGPGNAHILIDIGGGVPGPDTQGRLARGIGGLDHARTTGGQDGGHTRVLHQGTGGVDRGVFDPLDAVLRSTCLDGCVTNDPGGFDRALLSERMEAEDNRAPGLQGDQRLEYGGGGRIGHRGDTGHDTNGLSHFNNAVHIILVDDAHRALLGQVVGHMLAGEDVLGGLVLDQTTPRLLDGHLGQDQVLVEGRDRSLGDDTVDLGLIELLEFLQSRLSPGDQNINLLVGADHHSFSLLCGSPLIDVRIVLFRDHLPSLDEQLSDIRKPDDPVPTG